MAARSRKAQRVGDARVDSWRSDKGVRVLLVDGDNGPFVLMSEDDGAKGSWHRLAPTTQRDICDALGVETLDEANFDTVQDVLNSRYLAKGWQSRAEWELEVAERDAALDL